MQSVDHQVNYAYKLSIREKIWYDSFRAQQKKLTYPKLWRLGFRGLTREPFEAVVLFICKYTKSIESYWDVVADVRSQQHAYFEVLW